MWRKIGGYIAWGVLVLIVYTIIAITAPFRLWEWWKDRRTIVTTVPYNLDPRVSLITHRSTNREYRAMRRGVGYCENADCEDFSKGVFLLNHGTAFYCPHCRQLGFVEPERGDTENEQQIFREVHVHYNYEPIEKKYREIGIVRDEGLPEDRTNSYHLFSPLIKTENRALKVAEAVLGNLNRYRGMLDGEGIPKTTEIVLSFDDELATFAKKLDELSKEWSASGVAEKAAVGSG
jgi:hypothetical protein